MGKKLSLVKRDLKNRWANTGYSPEKIFVVDTSALEHGEDIFNILHDEGKNCIIIPFATWEELDSHKKTNDFRGKVARAVIRDVLRLYKQEDPSVSFFKPNFNLANEGVLNKTKNDHQIIATVLNVHKKFPKHDIVLITMDISLQVTAMHFGIKTEEIKVKKTETEVLKKKTRSINVKKEDVKNGRIHLPKRKKDINFYENEGILCYGEDNNSKWGAHYLAIKKGDYLIPVPDDISLFNVSPKSNNGEKNWKQFEAMAVLKDQTIPLITLTGSAGTAKTFLALLAALDQKKLYKQILITRATIPLGNKDRLGYNPGKIEEKMHPWLLPIYDNLDAIKNLTGEGKEIEKLLAEKKIEVLDLDKIRGRSIQRRFIIVDEAQNLSPDNILAIATRGAEETKIVFTGDFSDSQIDVPWLSETTNGLSALTGVMRGSKLFATVHLDQAIRSELTQEIISRWGK